MAEKIVDKKKYSQVYTTAWEKDPELLIWIASDPTCIPTRAFCRYCKCSLIAHKKSLIDHFKSIKHNRQMDFEKQAKHCKPLNFNASKSELQKEAELKLSVYVAEHSSINAVDHLCELLPVIDVKSSILCNLKLHRTKCSMLLKNVVAPCMLISLIEDVKNAPYSLIVDESTDVASEKILCLMIRYFSEKRNTIVTTFYRLILVERCDAQGLFDAVSRQLADDNLQLKNLIGIGVDGANVMIGNHHSFTTLLKSVVPDIVIVKCVCHSLHLCAENACKELPSQLEYFVREVHNYFSHSPKRINEYKQLYSSLNNDKLPNKISKLAGTRWLARFHAVATIISQWMKLYSFFNPLAYNHE